MKQLVNGAIEALHDQSLPTIELLQTSFPDNKDLMINISTWFDPRYVFLVYAPILFALNKRVAHRTIIALTLTEWANQILKWLLAGERPYWYALERASYLNGSALVGAGLDGLLARSPAPPQLKQFPVTCELGAGSPSGHAMVTATVWYILVDAYLKGELPLLAKADYSGSGSPSSPSSPGNKLARASWAAYALVLLSVSLSRVYLACHFPHQCVGGAALGLLVGRLVVDKLDMERLAKHHFCFKTSFMLASALGTYAALRSMGFDPLWSVDKAMRWCANKDHIHLDTTPFFSMTRYLGFCLGAGLAYEPHRLAQCESKGAASGQSALLARRLATAGASIGFGQLLLALPVPKSNLNLFYVISFFLYAVFSYAIAGPIPRLVSRLARQIRGRPCKSAM